MQIHWETFKAGVENDRSQSDFGAEVTNSSTSHKAEAESEECSSWTRQQKYLRNLTENALKKNQPLVIINLMHEKTDLLSAEDLSGTLKVEQMCLQALCILAFPGGPCIEVPYVNLHEENHDVASSNSKACTTASTVASTIPDSDLPNIVSVIQSCPQGMSRLLESLQKRFPDVPKTLLKNKVREISDYDPVVNRWKVKKDILGKLGMTTPEKTKLGTKSIATFFSKRCLPPAGHVVNICESSPEPMKRGSSSQQPHESTKNV
ncbi:hypothetical protein KSS87_015807 [Heliosperma pusillum]|nr:hypothetical protein KSS87_015807 [Heliosperma pusillum]